MKQFKQIAARTRHASLPIFHRPDHIAEKYYHLSPYTYCAGDPLNYIDPTGNEISMTVNGKCYFYDWSEDENSFLFINENGQSFDGNNGAFMYAVENALSKIKDGGEVGNALIKSIIKSDERLNIIESDANSYSYEEENGIKTHTLKWNADSDIGGPSAIFSINPSSTFPIGNKLTNERPPYIGLGHELAHFYDKINGITTQKYDWFLYNDKVVSSCEIFAMYVENCLRIEAGIPLRVAYYSPSLRNPDMYGQYCLI